jgi:hypothetical protein
MVKAEPETVSVWIRKRNPSNLLTTIKSLQVKFQDYRKGNRNSRKKNFTGVKKIGKKDFSFFPDFSFILLFYRHSVEQGNQ